MFKIASEEVIQLPSVMRQCSVVYVPHVGFLLSVDPWWNPNEPAPDFHQFDDLRWVFNDSGRPYFKTKRCFHLDQTIGDVGLVIHKGPSI